MAGETFYVRDSVTKIELLELMLEKENNKQKWQLVSLAMFGDPDDPRFAFIAHYPNLRPWTVEHDVVSQLDHISRAIPKAADGYYATIVTGTGAGDLARPDYFRLTVVYEKFPPDINPAPVLTIYESWDEMVAGIGDQNSMIVSFDSFGTVKSSGGKKVYLERCANIRYNQTQAFWLPWSVQKLDDVPKNDAAGVQHSAKNSAVMKNWARIEHAVPSRWGFTGRDATFVNYRKDMYEPWPESLQDEFVQGKRVVGPVNFNDLNYHRDIWVNEYGYWPHRIGANGSGSNPRYCCTFVPFGKREPKARYFMSIDATQTNPPQKVKIVSSGALAGAGGFLTSKTIKPSAAFGSGLKLPPAPPPPRWRPAPFTGMPRSRTDISIRGGAPIQTMGGTLPWDAGLGDGSSFGGGVTRDGADLGGTVTPTGLNGPLTPPTKAELEVGLDQRARLEMEVRCARHAQLVISVDGKCKFARAYTYGEAGYPCTQMHHKFVVASVAKWLTCMAVLHHFTDPSAGIEGMRQQLASVLLPEAFNLVPRGGFFDTTSLEDLLSFRSGWNGQWSLQAASKDLVGGNFAEPGDMRLYFGFAPGWHFEGLYSTTPGSTYAYNNDNFIALGEIVSARASAPPGSPPSQLDFKKCRQTMLQFWSSQLLNAEDFADPVPKTVENAFDRNVSPQHSYFPGWKSDWINEQTPILGPNVYTGENEWWLGTDWAMTMPMLARILDGYLDDPAPPVKKLLDPSHALLMSKGPPGDEGRLLGLDVAGDVTIGGGTYRRLFKNGGEDGASTIAALYWKLSGTGPQSISIAFSMDGGRATMGPMSSDIMLPTIRNLLFWGHWHDGLNLYELLF